MRANRLSLPCRVQRADVLEADSTREDVLLRVVLERPAPEEPYEGHGVRLTRRHAAALHRFLGEWLEKETP